ncbi:adenosylcobinamide-phosphate synthase CbiB [Paenibacillus sp. HJGM_3]|uniref:adenosylcobinamide-phosphate synthase CbiB n=1 Tax=Paenibacillus sp. HJGM_3 TaxID=3379816 RepID=UPI00385B4B8F
MLFYSIQETAWMVAAAIALDWLIGDPRWLTHPVIWIGKVIHKLSAWLRREEEARRQAGSPLPAKSIRARGAALTLLTVTLSFLVVLVIWFIADQVHPWLGYAVNVWFISTTIAVRGLRDAALLVYNPLRAGNLPDARKYVGYIVGRDTDSLSEREITRATVETVAENTVDAVVSPLFFAFLGGAPAAMLYRAANTLDSMVGYKNERFLHFGWASARFDDLLNYIPARITGGLITVYCLLEPSLSARQSLRSIRRFANLHPSPNSGVPESAVAGALGIQLGGTNVYGSTVSERAKMGRPNRELEIEDIVRTNRICYGVSALIAGGMVCVIAWLNL